MGHTSLVRGQPDRINLLHFMRSETVLRTEQLSQNKVGVAKFSEYLFTQLNRTCNKARETGKK